MDTIEKPKETKKISLDFDVKGKAGNDIIKFKELTIGYKDKIILNELNFNLYHGERICIIGKNGAGKSTLIKAIISACNEQEIPGYISGETKIGGNISIGYIPQEIHFEDETQTVVDNFRDYFKGEETRLRATLVHFGFTGESIYKPVGKLSGGEKVKLLLCELIQSKVNILIFDEPTNHIDADTRNTLEAALLEYKGTILFVSHDRYFINKIATSVAELSDGKIDKYVGNYDEFKEAKKRFEQEKIKRQEEKQKNINTKVKRKGNWI